MTPRPPLRSEIAELHAMALELADFEKISHLVRSTPADIERAIFDEKILEGLVVDSPDGEGLAGFAIFYRNFSSFTGKSGLWLEDLYVRPQFRGQGFGRSLLTVSYKSRKNATTDAPNGRCWSGIRTPSNSIAPATPTSCPTGASAASLFKVSSKEN